MSTERDDPVRRNRSGESGNAALPPAREGEARLAAWARLIGALLLQQNGVPKAVVDEIVDHALRAYHAFRNTVPSPCTFLVHRIRKKGKAYMDLRGIVPATDPERLVPPLLDVAKTQAAFDLLKADRRRALQILYEEGQSRDYQDVADDLGITVGYAKHLTDKALEQLRWWIAQTWPEEQR